MTTSDAKKYSQIVEACDIERVFLASNVLPSAADAFSAQVNSVEEAIKTGDIVIDTNVLLIPYGTGSASLMDIIAIYKRLKTEKRIFLPAQVAREFIKNRPNKIAELQQALLDKVSRIATIDKFSFPIMEDIDEYKKLNELIEKVKSIKKEIAKENSELISKINSWEWSDPVNSLYKDVFTRELIIETDGENNDVLEELLRRQHLSIPPGYKDSGKDDLGVGDFLIWKTIIKLGMENKKDIIFVSGDEKADWQHRAGGNGFLPRFELLDEYRRASEGKAFYIIQLSKLLELLRAKQDSVNEIKQEESRIQESNTAEVNCPFCEHKVTSRLGDQPGHSAHPICPNCGQRFHLHRTREGVTIHKPFEKAEKASSLKMESVTCPVCANVNNTKLHADAGSTVDCECNACGLSFPVHRLHDGGVRVSMYGQNLK
ncbi:PIN domain-containing protein [Chromobacterium sinusclupearum]|uniref:PIN domain-containing protein n=1 Tax=Chromobacterium sinusclupearum TaxID=2077146 RepID=UPI0011AF32E3|nr:PIN domain-containing protein [Chromobacterium sinusclupearum]